MKNLEIIEKATPEDCNNPAYIARLKELEQELNEVKREKCLTSKEYGEALDRIKTQESELKDAICQRKLAMMEYAEVTDKLSELRSQKQKLSRQVSLHFVFNVICLIVARKIFFITISLFKPLRRFLRKNVHFKLFRKMLASHPIIIYYNHTFFGF